MFDGVSFKKLNMKFTKARNLNDLDFKDMIEGAWELENL